MVDSVNLALPRKVGELLRRKKQLEADLKGVNNELAAAQRDLLEMMSDTQQERIHVDGVTYFHREQLWARPKDKEALCAQLRQQGLGDLVKDDVNTHTLSSYIREQYELLDHDLRNLPEWMHQYMNITVDHQVGVRGL